LPELLKRFKMRCKAKLWFVILAIVSGCSKDLLTDTNDPILVYESFWNQLKGNFAYFDLTTFDRDSVYHHYKRQITTNTTDHDLEQMLTAIINLTHDPHTNLFTPSGVMGNTDYFDHFSINPTSISDTLFDEPLIATRIFDYGIIKNKQLGYLKIKTFEGDNALFAAIDTIIPLFQSTKGLIIDVRGNLGGKISNCNTVAQHLTQTSILTCRSRSRNGASLDSFTPWQDVYVSPASGIIYSKPMIILTSRFTFSASERFVLTAHALKQTIVVGDTTTGGSGIPVVCELSNGWILRTSNTQTELLSGEDFQGKGIAPDITITLTGDDLTNCNDAILNKAIELLAENNY